jgi:hypothetical protein
MIHICKCNELPSNVLLFLSLLELNLILEVNPGTSTGSFEELYYNTMTSSQHSTDQL